MFESVKATRISDQIVAQLRRLVLEGKLKPGQRLPTETELAEKFEVSRASVREALSVLESEGLVERRKNEGTFLRRYSLNRVLSAVEFPRKLDHELFADLVEAREKLELQIVELAAQRADDLDLLRIERTLEMMEKDLAAGRSGIEADILFHQCLAAATKNQVLAGLVRSIGRMMQETRARTLVVPGRLAACLEEHRAIYEAVRDHDAERGCRLIQEHLNRVREILTRLDREMKGEG
ncbi:MAG: FadR/GntR family transcriptional regulator [Bacillota bacterium]|nr:FadR/GntR family transcriptional regulator [Bacillota bacterium]